MQTNSSFLGTLTSEINDRIFVGFLAVVVLLAHFWLVIVLMQSTDSDKKDVPVKVMEVALVTLTPPKEEPPKPLPPKKPENPPKKVEPPKPAPKKKEVKPPVKQKEPVIHKEGEIAKPKTVAKEVITAPPVLTNPFAKTETPVAKPQAPVAAKPAAKSGNGDNSNKGGSSGVVPLVRVQPTYPMRAASRRIEGWVKIEFTVTASGGVANPSVAGSSPPGIFDDAALDAIKKWKFKQKIVDGSPVAQRAVQVLKFKLVK